VADDGLEARWMEDVTTMTNYYKTKTKPPIEPLVVWDEEKRAYSNNWMVTRSNYFDLIHGRDKDEFEKDIKNLVNRINSRVKKAKTMKPDISDEQIKQILAPYIAGELSGKLHIVKEVQVT